MTRLLDGNLAMGGESSRLAAWRDLGFDLDRCPVRRILDHVAAKWTILILLELKEAPKRFNEMARTLPDISRRMLTQGLRDLERDGILVRTVYDTRPPSVDYRLTGLGRSLMDPLMALVDWASENFEIVFSAQEKHDLREASALET